MQWIEEGNTALMFRPTVAGFVKVVLDQGVDPNLRNKEGDDSLSKAVLEQDANRLKRLIKYGRARIDGVYNYSGKAVSLFTMNLNEFLGLDFNYYGDRRSTKRCMMISETLLESGIAECVGEDEISWSPKKIEQILSYVIMSHSIRTLDFFISRKLYPDGWICKSGEPLIHSLFPEKYIHHLKKSELERILTTLIENNAEINEVNSDGKTALHLVASKTHQRDYFKSYSRTPISVNHPRSSWIEPLLKVNADLTRVDRFGNTPLYCCLMALSSDVNNLKLCFESSGVYRRTIDHKHYADTIKDHLKVLELLIRVGILFLMPRNELTTYKVFDPIIKMSAKVSGEMPGEAAIFKKYWAAVNKAKIVKVKFQVCEMGLVQGVLTAYSDKNSNLVPTVVRQLICEFIFGYIAQSKNLEKEINQADKREKKAIYQQFEDAKKMGASVWSSKHPIFKTRAPQLNQDMKASEPLQPRQIEGCSC